MTTATALWAPLRALLTLTLLLVTPLAQADHGAPPPRLGGVSFCTDRDSVRLEVVGGAGERPGFAGDLAARALQHLRAALERAEVPHEEREVCAGERGYVALELYARFLDPETYLGFPEASYTYVAATQVGAHAPTRSPEGALPESVYVASASDILQAPSEAALAAELLALTDEQAQLLTRTWLEANVVPPGRFARFGALALALVLVRALAPWALRARG
ncbi:conserved hypothetical protein [Truepera radiovictrix DSM 17093]|uniref:Uncharacterized protein n=1 Tax=Truepera radiovictrix (strain DSM 17093 / CIP 108686 / LMG 22925 / RQ-24) TaxID=649638 RepID=D7CVG7_TRURR|nr:conserved hypothetical protein [Truepera radiovictrix DSM 17093]